MKTETWKILGKYGITPSNLESTGSVDLRKYTIKSLPPNLTINGDFAIPKALIKIPNITVKGNLYMGGSEVTELHCGIKVLGNIDADGSAIEYISEGFTVGGDLEMRNCENFKKSPDSINLGGCWILVNSEIKTVGSKVNVRGLNLIGTPITEIPSISIPDFLTVEHCNNLRRLPKSISANFVSLSELNVKEIFDNSSDSVIKAETLRIGYKPCTTIPSWVNVKKLELEWYRNSPVLESIPPHIDKVEIYFNGDKDRWHVTINKEMNSEGDTTFLIYIRNVTSSLSKTILGSTSSIKEAGVKVKDFIVANS